MKRYFLDTNILIDFVADRKPFSQHVLKLFQLPKSENELWTSDNSITTTYYILEQQLGREEAKRKLGLLLKHLFIQPIEKQELVTALTQTFNVQPIEKQELVTALTQTFNDYEDAVQYMAALKQGSITAIITRNKKDFKTSKLPILAPDELFDQ